MIMEASMRMFRLGTALVLTALMTTGAFARGGGGHGGAMGHGTMGPGATAARQGLPPLLLNNSIPSMNNPASTLSGPVGSPSSSLSTPFGSRLGAPAGTLYPGQMNSLRSIGAGAPGSLSTQALTTPPDVTPSVTGGIMPGLGTPQIMVPERPL
jgi:hypothetical protein